MLCMAFAEGHVFSFTISPAVAPIGTVSLQLTMSSGGYLGPMLITWSTTATQQVDVTITALAGTNMVNSFLTSGPDAAHYSTPLTITSLITAKSTWNVSPFPTPVYQMQPVVISIAPVQVPNAGEYSESSKAQRHKRRCSCVAYVCLSCNMEGY